MKKNVYSLPMSMAILLMMSSICGAHCEIPCGIYDDAARLAEISEHVTTIEKSVKEILDLKKQKVINYNQLVRWIDNKEEHAGKIQHLASQYFLTQRIKFDSADYDAKLEALHHLLVYSMKCKQTVDPAAVKDLRDASREFEKLYMGEQK